jgi:hypothetical protein
MLLNASTRRCNSSAVRATTRWSRSPAAMRRLARVSRCTGSPMRPEIEKPSAAPSRMNTTAPRFTLRSSSAISRSISRCRSVIGTVRIASRAPTRIGVAASW